MTPYELLKLNRIELQDTRPGRHYTTCPECSAKRKPAHQKLKCLGVTIEPDGGVRWGCNHCSWTGPSSHGGNGTRPPLAAHVYRDRDGNVRFRKVRNLPGRQPRFWLEHWDEGAGWQKGAGHADTSILYRIDEVADAIEQGRVIAVVEGEKDADNLWKIGIPATCNAHGASEPGKKPKWTAKHSEQLRGAAIVVFNDNDPAGYAHSDTTCKLSRGVAKRVRRLDLKNDWAEIPKEGDVSDWLATGGEHTADRLTALIEAATDFADNTETSASEAASASDDAETSANEAASSETASDDDAELERLARLLSDAPLEYGRERPKAAERLGSIPLHILDRAVRGKLAELGLDAGDNGKQGHAISFPEAEPWPEPVNGAQLLDDITKAILRYVVMAEHFARACTLWCLHTYLLDCFLISPRLAIRSATHRCGKTTLLDVVSYLVMRALPSANVTAASVFRVVEACRPTLLIDEADTFLPEAEELRGVINSGHRKGGTVIRTVGDDHEPRQFSTHSACAIALIGKLPVTLHDRSAPVIDLKRRLRSEEVENFRLDRTADLDELARKAASWAADHAEQLRNADPQMPAGLFSRDADNWRPLLAIAEAAGGHWPEQARKDAALCCAVTGVEDASKLELLLGDIRDVLAGTSADEITSKTLVERLVEIEGHSWSELGRNKKSLTQNGLARMLKPLGIGTQKVGPEDKRLAGYTRKQFKEPFARYLKPLSEDPSSQSASEGVSQPDIRTECDEMGTSEHFQNGQPDRGCPVEKCEKPNNDGLLSGCPVAKGGTTGPDEREERNGGEPARSTPRTGLAPRAVDHLAREFSELKTGSFAELENALRSRLAKYVPPEAVDVEVERVVRRIEALVGADDTVVSFPAHVGAAKPYEVIEPAPAGEKCFRCGKSGGVMQIKHGGEVNLFHPDCADFHFAARVDPPVKVPDLGPDPYDDHGAPRAGSVPFMITQAQKRLLRAHGYSDEDIANLTPQQAHEILTQEGRQPNA